VAEEEVIAGAVSTAVPGPVDRVHFFDDQRRNRRASWRFSVFVWLWIRWLFH
jgi:hypothetical protein